MKLGLDSRRGLNGSRLAVYILELSSILPAFYVFVITGYPAALTGNGLFSFLCDLSFCLTPRLLLGALAHLYSVTLSELAVCFTLPVLALVFGLFACAGLRDRKRARRSCVVFSLLLALDLILRLLPLRLNRAFGPAATITAFCVLLLCLVLTLLDLRASGHAS